MERARVALVKGDDPYTLVKKALRMVLDIPLKDKGGVVIKPNYVVPSKPDSGVVTDPRVLDALIYYLKTKGVEDLIIAEGGAGNTWEAFREAKVDEVARRHGVKLIDLNEDDRVEVEIPGATHLKRIGIAKTILKADLIVNVAKLKVHHIATVSLGMKNLMGVISPKSIMHLAIHEKIVDLYGFLREKVVLTVIDGIIAPEKDEVYGKPVKMGVLLAGRDTVAVDTVGAFIMGIKPSSIGHIRLASKRGMGVGDLGKIHVLGENPLKIKRRFELPETVKGVERV